MRVSTILTGLFALGTAVSAAPVAVPAASSSSSSTIVTIGKRNMILPTTCSWKDPKDNKVYDVTRDLNIAMDETRTFIASAIIFNPESFNWFDQFVPYVNKNYEQFLRLGQAASLFASPREEFSTINVVCTPPPQCSEMKENDGSDRLMVTDWENDIIYLCPRIFRDPGARQLIGEVQAAGGADTASLDNLCPDNDGEAKVDQRYSLSDYGQYWATVISREVTHTGSTIRKASKDLRYDDLDLHALIERYGWMYTMAYWERRCGYEIPLVKATAPDNRFGWVKQTPFYGPAPVWPGMKKE